jgi:hypothetical protein
MKNLIKTLRGMPAIGGLALKFFSRKGEIGETSGMSGLCPNFLLGVNDFWAECLGGFRSHDHHTADQSGDGETRSFQLIIAWSQA